MFYFPNVSPKNLTQKFCSLPWNTITVEGGGNVFSCTCARWTSYPLGNLLETPLEELFKSSKPITDIRESVLAGTYDWCVESNCNEIGRLPDKKSNDPFTEFGIDANVHLPTNITLAIDPNCNLKCASCRSSKYFTDQLDPVVEKILDNLSNAYRDFNEQVIVMFDGSGDIFVSRAYQDFLFSDKLPKCWKLMLMTNGNLLTKRKNDIERIKNQIDNVTVSLDAGIEETYAITRGGSFESVLKGIAMLKEMNISIHLQFVLQYANYKDLLEYKKIANDFGVGYGVQKIGLRPHMADNYWKTATIEDNPNVDYALLKEYLKILQNDPTCNLDGGTRWLLAKL